MDFRVVSFVYQALFGCSQTYCLILFSEQSLEPGGITATTVLQVQVLKDESVLSGSQLLNGGKELRPVCVTTSLMFFLICWVWDLELYIKM